MSNKGTPLSLLAQRNRQAAHVSRYTRRTECEKRFGSPAAYRILLKQKSTLHNPVWGQLKLLIPTLIILFKKHFMYKFLLNTHTPTHIHMHMSARALTHTHTHILNNAHDYTLIENFQQFIEDGIITCQSDDVTHCVITHVLYRSTETNTINRLSICTTVKMFAK